MARRDSLYFVQLSGVPRDGHPDAPYLTGVTMYCWTTARSNREAFGRARELLEINDYVVGVPDRIDTIDEATYVPPDVLAPVYEQALELGEAFAVRVFSRDQTDEFNSLRFRSWRRWLFSHPFGAGRAGSILIVAAVAITLAAAIGATAAYHAFNLPSLGVVLAYAFAGVGVGAFFLGLPLAWRATLAHERREQRTPTLRPHTLTRFSE